MNDDESVRNGRNVGNVENVRTLTDTKCQTFLEPDAPADLNDDGNVRNDRNVGNVRNVCNIRNAESVINVRTKNRH